MCAPKYIYLLAEVKWRGTGFMEMNGEVLHLRWRKVFPGIWSYRDVERDIQVLERRKGVELRNISKAKCHSLLIAIKSL